MINFDEEMIRDQMQAINSQVQVKTMDESVDDDDDSATNITLDDIVDQNVDVEIRAVDLGSILSDFNWIGDAAALEATLVSELQALEAANVHDIIQSEERANGVITRVEHALQELQQIEDWLEQYTDLLQVFWHLCRKWGWLFIKLKHRTKEYKQSQITKKHCSMSWMLSFIH
jgi:hypothetical protein